jgi:hypothetical protein
VVTESAAAEIADIRAVRGEAGYRIDVHDLREFLQGYFYATPGCTASMGASISPLGATSSGGKILKVRWKYPGAGKSGGLRLCIVAFCEQLLVVLCHAAIRRDVEHGELLSSALEADQYIDASYGDDEDEFR